MLVNFDLLYTGMVLQKVKELLENGKLRGQLSVPSEISEILEKCGFNIKITVELTRKKSKESSHGRTN